jgi:hypothetical protein
LSTVQLQAGEPPEIVPEEEMAPTIEDARDEEEIRQEIASLRRDINLIYNAWQKDGRSNLTPNEIAVMKKYGFQPFQGWDGRSKIKKNKNMDDWLQAKRAELNARLAELTG